MRNLIITLLALFAIAIIAPESRSALVVGFFCLLFGFMYGMQVNVKEYVKRMDARTERMKEAKGLRYEHIAN